MIIIDKYTHEDSGKSMHLETDTEQGYVTVIIDDPCSARVIMQVPLSWIAFNLSVAAGAK